MAHILVVEDEGKMRHLLSILLERKGYRVDQACDGMEALEMIQATPYDLVISDIKMPNLSGTELLDRVNALNIVCPFIFITAFATVESAVDMMRRGAVDYICKPFDESRIFITIERTLQLSRIITENRNLKEELEKVVGTDRIVYASDAMKSLMALSERVAKSDSAVLINGESGTGKELIARYIHNESARGKGKFVPVNCAAISPGLVESELFGHEKGAFTGADRRSQGKFEYASAGTLFLDEIGDLPLEAQAKLLRALQEEKVQRVGGNQEIAVDVRIICATNKHLEDLVAQKQFRKDLFFRINVFPIQPPPLRERKEDILPLANHFIEKLSPGKPLKLTDGAIRLLTEYAWPGNIRELGNAIERAVILVFDQDTITTETLSFLKSSEGNGCAQCNFQLPPEGISLQALQEDIVNQALALTHNNQTNAAKLLGLTRAKFRVLMKQTLS